MQSQLQEALGMFVFLAVELSALFIGVSLLVGVLQRHIPPEKVESLLSSSRRRGYFLAAGLGAITPFCSCSTIPMLKGLIRAKAGFGPMMVFLFSSPLLNPVIVALLVATFGLKLTAVYVVAALGVALGAGWLLRVLGFERYVRSDTGSTQTNSEAAVTSCCGTEAAVSDCGNDTTNRSCGAAASTPPPSRDCCAGPASEPTATQSRYSGLWREAWDDFVDVLPYLLIGIAIGSAIYGFMPTAFLQQYAGPNNPFAIPVAAVIGVPLYIRAEAVIPLAAALMAKGVGAGSVLALIIGSAGASLTELILLRSLFTLKLLAAFVTVIFSMAIIAGYATYLFF